MSSIFKNQSDFKGITLNASTEYDALINFIPKSGYGFIFGVAGAGMSFTLKRQVLKSVRRSNRNILVINSVAEVGDKLG